MTMMMMTMMMMIGYCCNHTECVITLVDWIMCDMCHLTVWAGQTCKTDLTVCMRRNISVVSFFISRCQPCDTWSWVTSYVDCTVEVANNVAHKWQ